MLRRVLTSVAFLSGCSLIVDLSGLEQRDASVNDATSDSAIDASGSSDTSIADATDSGEAGSDCGCGPLVSKCSPGCPLNTVCVTKQIGPTTLSDCYRLPKCGCDASSLCACMGTCVCGGEQCNENNGNINCANPISRREYKADIHYLTADERALVAERTLRSCPNNVEDLYGYASSVLATVQEQQREIDDLKRSIDALESTTPSLQVRR